MLNFHLSYDIETFKILVTLSKISTTVNTIVHTISLIKIRCYIVFEFVTMFPTIQ